MLPPGQSPLVWKVQACVIVTALLALYAGVLRDLALTWWNDPAASYGMLIPPVAMYTAWARRSATFELPASPSNWGLVVVLGACLLYLAGKLGAEFYLTRISFVVLLAALVATFWGFRRLRTLAFPLVLLGTMVPLPVLIYNAMAAPLQLLASTAATDISQALGIAIYQDGNIIHLANISLGVAEACSGLQSLSSLVIGAVMLGYLQCSRLRTKLALVLAAPLLSVSLNVVRVTLTAILADRRQDLAEGFYHFFAGWALFVCGFLLLWLIGKTLHRFLD